MAKEPTQPRLADLLSRYLDRQVEANHRGTAAVDQEVTPYDAGPVRALDPGHAWEEATATLKLWGQAASVRIPSPWPQLVAAQEPLVAVPMALPHFPQLVRNLHTLLSAQDIPALRPRSAGAPMDLPALQAWVAEAAASASSPQLILALGTLRFARWHAEAEAFVHEHQAAIAQAWRRAWENEVAALEWMQGRTEPALARWRNAEPSVVASFNLGMAELFAGDAGAAQQALQAAVSQLPANQGWHHLGRLYLALAQARR